MESALFLLYMQIISLNNLTANIFWFLTPCPGQEQAVFPADPLASFGALGLGYFDFKEAREACETGWVAGEKKPRKQTKQQNPHNQRGKKGSEQTVKLFCSTLPVSTVQDATGSDFATSSEPWAKKQTSPGWDATPTFPPPPAQPWQRSLTCLPAAARQRRRSQQPDGTGMSGCPSLPPPVAPFPATEEKLDPSSQAPVPRQQSEAHLG